MEVTNEEIIRKYNETIFDLYGELMLDYLNKAQEKALRESLELFTAGRDALRAQEADSQPLTPNWISVEDSLPDNEIPVLIAIERHYEKWEEKTKRYEEHIAHAVVKAFHTDGKHNTENSDFCWSGDDMSWDYVEEEDAYIIPEGWWEYPYYADEFAAVSDFVTHWMPLPKAPSRCDV